VCTSLGDVVPFENLNFKLKDILKPEEDQELMESSDESDNDEKT
jgi:hypothetical protein